MTPNGKNSSQVDGLTSRLGPAPTYPLRVRRSSGGLVIGCFRIFGLLRPVSLGTRAFHFAGELWAAGMGDGEWAAAKHRPGACPDA